MSQKILVAEDNPGLARVMEFKLRQQGFEVVVCPDGQAAWEQVQQAHFDAVVTDFEMPRLNGAELCEKIRGEESLADVPIVLVTAREPELNQDVLKSQGITRVYSKPYSPRELIESIQELLDEAAKL